VSYNGYITKIKDLRKHSNADRLQAGTCFGNQVIVSMETTEGQMGVYFPTDGRLGEEYCIENNLLRKKNDMGVEIGGYLDERRHVTSLKLRKEMSDGLFMPLESLSKFTDIKALKDGDMITVLNGITICEKYIVKSKCTNSINKTKKETKKESRKSKSKFVFFNEHINTTQLAYNKHQFAVGDLCYITLKVHGTSARTAFSLQETKSRQTFLTKLFKKKTITRAWKPVSGSRRVTLNFEKNNGGYYKDNGFREKYHSIVGEKLHKGETFFYEIVGYTGKDSFIMGQCNNKKLNDKDFVKKYGEITSFTYGCENGENDIYGYRMTMTNEDGYEVEYSQELLKLRCEQMGIKCVTEFDKFIFTTIEDLMERVDKFYDGVDPVGKTHIREGVVVRIDGKEKFKAFKHKNDSFKILEGIIKADAVEPDMEEAEDGQEAELGEEQ